MHNFKIVTWFILAFSTVCHNVFGQLEWESRLLEFKPTVADTNIVAVYKFENKSDHPIKILSMKSSCGCTEIKTATNLYLPHEKGTVEATFNFGDRVGFQEKQIVVRTDDRKESTILLTLRAHIPPVAKITPPFAYWNIGDTQSVKTIKIDILVDSKVNIKSIESSSESFNCSIITNKQGFSYLLNIYAQKTDQAQQATINIFTDYPVTKPRVFIVNSYIK